MKQSSYSTSKFPVNTERVGQGLSPRPLNGRMKLFRVKQSTRLCGTLNGTPRVLELAT